MVYRYVQMRICCRVRPMVSRERENKEENVVRMGENDWTLEVGPFSCWNPVSRCLLVSRLALLQHCLTFVVWLLLWFL